MSAPRLSTRRLGEILLERGKLTSDQVQIALRDRLDPRLARRM